MDVQVKTARYFWSGWFSGQSFRTLAGVFVLLSGVDLYATLRLLSLGTQEANPMALYALRTYGVGGFAVYKVLLVVLVLLALGAVWPRNSRLSAGVLWGANLLMTYVTLVHISLLSLHLYLSGR